MVDALPQLVVAPVAGLAVLICAWLGGRFARCHAGRDRATPDRRTPALVSAGTGLGAALTAVTLGLDDRVAAAIAPPSASGDVAVTLATVLLFLGPVPAVAGAAHAGAGGSLRGFARGYSLLVGPALVAVAAAPLFPDGWLLVGTVASIGALVALTAPLVVRRIVGARPLSRTERARLAPDADETVLVLDIRRPNAFAAGLPPGPRVVLVTEGLLDRLPPAAAAAVVAHEVGHHRRHHVALRLGAVAVFVLPWLGTTATGVPGAFSVGCLLAVPYALGLVRLMRWTEHDADEYAARHADGEALATGLRLLAGDHPRGLVARALSPHPSLAERAGRMSRATRA